MFTIPYLNIKSDITHICDYSIIYIRSYLTKFETMKKQSSTNKISNEYNFQGFHDEYKSVRKMLNEYFNPLFDKKGSIFGEHILKSLNSGKEWLLYSYKE